MKAGFIIIRQKQNNTLYNEHIKVLLRQIKEKCVAKQNKEKTKKQEKKLKQKCKNVAAGKTHI